MASPATTAQSILAVYNVRDFGARGDGAADDSAAIAAAIQAAGVAGGEVYLPRGTYRVATPPTISAANVHVRGAGPGATVIANANAGAAGWRVTGTGGSLRDFTIGPSVVRSPGQYEFTLSGLSPQATYGAFPTFGYRIENVTVAAQGSGQCWGAFNFTAPLSGSVCLSKVFANGPPRFLSLDTITDLYVTQTLAYCQAPNGTPGAMIGIEGTGIVEAITISDCDFIAANNACTSVLRSSNPNFGYNKISNTYFDSAPIGVQIDAGLQLDMIGCWFSNRPGDGVVINGGNNIRLVGGQAYNGGGRGVYLAGGWGHLVQGFSVVATGQSGAAPAIEVGGSCAGARVLGCNAAPSDGAYSGSISVGCLIDAGATNVIVDQNDFHLSASGVTNNSGQASVKIGTNL